MAIEDELILRNMQNYFANQREQQEIMNARDARVADAMARQGAINRQMPVNNLRPRMLDTFPMLGDLLDYGDQKITEAIDIGDMELAERRGEAFSGLIRNRGNLSLSEMGRQADLDRARLIARIKADQVQNEQNALEVGPHMFGQTAMNVGPHMFANVGPIEEVYEPENKAEAATILGIDFGGFKAQQKNKNQGLLSPEGSTGDSSFSIENLLGGVKDVVNDPFIATLLQIAAQPEAFTDPRGLGAGIATAGQNVFAAQAQAEKEAAAAQLEYDKLETELIKAQAKASGDQKLTDTMLKVIDRSVAGGQALQNIGKIRDILASKGAGGVPGKFSEYLTDFRALFRMNPGENEEQVVQRLHKLLYNQVSEALGTGREISEADREILRTVIPEPGLLMDTNRLLDSLNNLEEFISKRLVSSRMLAERYGFGANIDAALAARPSTFIASKQKTQ